MAGRLRVAIAFGFIGAMIVALLLLLDRDSDSATAAQPAPTSTPTTIAGPPTTSSTSTSTSTTLDAEARKAEVEEILEDLEIAWYDAVYRQDVSVLPQIVATRLFYDAAINAMDTAEFAAPPNKDTVDVTVFEVLVDREDCLVVYHRLDITELLPGTEPTDGVQSLWPTRDGYYRLVRLWESPSDLWIEDCDSLARGEIP